MAKFVNCFFPEPLRKQSVIALQPIELLPQAMERNNGKPPSQLGLPENILQNRNVQIDRSDAEYVKVCRAKKGLHPLQNLG